RQAGQLPEARAALDEADDFARATGEGYWGPELHRLRGELLLPADPEGAERCFRQALDLASEQQARSLELRAAMSLARLVRQQGQAAPARDLLGRIYGSFTEGFATHDLGQAKALLEALS